MKKRLKWIGLFVASVAMAYFCGAQGYGGAAHDNQWTLMDIPTLGGCVGIMYGFFRIAFP